MGKRPRPWVFLVFQRYLYFHYGKIEGFCALNYVGVLLTSAVFDLAQTTCCAYINLRCCGLLLLINSHPLEWEQKVRWISPYVFCLLFSKNRKLVLHVPSAFFSKTSQAVVLCGLLVSSSKYHAPSYHGCFLRRRSGSKTQPNYNMSQMQRILLFQKRQQQAHVSFWLLSRKHVGG